MIGDKLKLNKNIYVATNFLETMIVNNSPTRGEVNDIYNTLEMGANGLVLAAETAIGTYPFECVQTLQKIIKIFHTAKQVNSFLRNCLIHTFFN